MSNPKKAIAYILLALAYGVPYVVYSKGTFMKLYNILPSALVWLIAFVGALPSLLLIRKAVNLFPGTDEQPNEHEYDFLPKVWRGEERLVLVFWLLVLPFALFLILGGQYVYIALMKATLASNILNIFALATLVSIYIFTIVAAWRSSNKYVGPGRWKILAKIGVVATSVLTFVGLMLPMYGISMFH